MKKKGPKPKGMVKIEWSADFAYAIGLIATDGCLINDGRHISFVSKDIELVEDFKEILHLTVKTGIKKRKEELEGTPFVQFGDVLFYEFLRSIGLTPAKSMTIGKIIIPSEYFFDFLRGCFDGDGCTYSYWDKRWRSSFMFYTSFGSGSLLFLEWLKEEIFIKLNIKGHITKNSSGRYFQLRYAKKESRILWNALYYPGVRFYLKRKKLKISVSLAMMDQRQINAQVAKLVDALP